MIVSLDPGNAVRTLLQTPFDECCAVISPEGHLIAYESARSGSNQVYVSEFPSMKGAVQVSINGGQNPVWAPDRRRLYFKVGLNVMAIDLAGGLTSQPQPAAVATFLATYPTAFVDPMANGRFLALDGAQIGGDPELRVILNWHEELKQRVPTR